MRSDRDAEGVNSAPADYGVWGSVVSSPSGVRDTAPGRKSKKSIIELLLSVGLIIVHKSAVKATANAL